MTQNKNIADILERLGKLHHPGLRFEVTRVITWEEMIAWLEAHGWQVIEHPNPGALVYRHADHKFKDGDPADIVLPAKSHFDGVAIQLEIAVNLLGGLYDRDPLTLVSEMVGLPSYYLLYGWRDDLLFLDSYVTGLLSGSPVENREGGKREQG